jgi:hypothetical protein
MYQYLREVTKPVRYTFSVLIFDPLALFSAGSDVAYCACSSDQGGEFVVRNFVGVIEDISPERSLVETELFPAGALHYYTKKNMGWDYTKEEYDTWQLAERGGAQGDYRDGMQTKIANVIDCLRTEPLSKRAVIPIPFNSEGSETVDWRDQGQVSVEWSRCATPANANVSCLSFPSSHQIHCACADMNSEQMLPRVALLPGGREIEVHGDRSDAEREHFRQEHSLLLGFD